MKYTNIMSSQAASSKGFVGQGMGQMKDSHMIS